MQTYKDQQNADHWAERLKNEVEKKPDLVVELLTLPTYVECKGVVFVCKLFDNGNELRLVYESLYDLPEGWVSPYSEAATFLFLVEDIHSEQDLRNAITETRKFLTDNDLMPNP